MRAEDLDLISETKKCKVCNKKVNNDDAELCNRCWELKTRIESNYSLALKIMGMIHNGKLK